jgi:hypothetical protein
MKTSLIAWCPKSAVGPKMLGKPPSITVIPQEAGDRPRLECEGQVVDGEELAEALAEMLDLDDLDVLHVPTRWHRLPVGIGGQVCRHDSPPLPSTTIVSRPVPRLIRERTDLVPGNYQRRRTVRRIGARRPAGSGRLAGPPAA